MNMTRTMRRLMLVFGVLTTVPVFAQSPTSLSSAPGSSFDQQRVRVTTSDAAQTQLTGTIVAMDEKTLTIINRGGKQVTIPRERVARLDVSVGRKRNALGGFLTGAAIGTVLGAAAAACKPGQFCPSPLPPAAVAAVSGAFFGGIGAAVGHSVKTDKWVKMPLERVRVGLQPGTC